MKKLTLLLLIFISNSILYAQNTSPWKIINQDKSTISNKNSNKLNAEDQLFFQLDEIAFKQSLSKIPNQSGKKIGVEITIPNKNGDLEKFLVWESSNFAPELQAKYPEIKGYVGIGITDRKASLNFSFSPSGLQTMILRANSGSEFIEQSANDKTVYTLFSSKKRDKGTLPFSCKTVDMAVNKQLLKQTAKTTSNNKVFKTLRLALSCTAEYTTYHGGTVAGALAGMNATMTRVNGVFNKDLAVKLELIANNNLLIYTNPDTDPYSPSTTGVDGTWSQELETTLNSVIGVTNYDLGHLFGASGGGGNADCIGCVCDSGKGRAYTSPSNSIPKGDTFDIDYVAHEMGHQLGANHTFSYDIEGTGVSVEPGSGSTIMSYAGISVDYDVQQHSDDYFAYASILQIQNNLATKTCPISTPITNSPPTIDAGLDRTIPYGTPFILKGTGSDANGDTITYCWEQNDSATTESGANSIALPTKKDGPLFRSISPSALPIRYMPAYSFVLADKLSTIWESVSTVERSLHFTLTGRDNSGQGSAQTNTDAMVVNVSGNIGPFAVTSQNTADLGWVQGTVQTITWSVNNSNTLTGSENVNIKLSTDGGLTFPTILVANTPNDGSEIITAPSITATNCRILVEPTANIYYSINSKPFAIGYLVASSCNTYDFVAPFPIVESANYTSKTISVPATTGTIVDVNVALGITHAYLSDVQVQMVSPQGTIVKLLERSCGSYNGSLLLNYDDLGDILSCGTTTAQTIMPEQLLSTFNGQNPQGTWTFKVRDSYTGDTGTIDSASITICTQNFTPIIPTIENKDVSLFPNPNRGNFTVQFASNSKSVVKIQISDLSGRKIFEKDYDTKVNGNFVGNIQLKNPQPGLYLMTIIDGGDRKEVKKIIIN